MQLINVVYSQVENLESKLNTEISTSESIFCEFEDRQRLKSDILIFNHPEVINDDYNNNYDLYKTGIQNLVKSLSVNLITFVDDLKISRIGKFFQACVNPNPIKVVCESQNQVSSILDAARILKSINSPLLQILSIILGETLGQQLNLNMRTFLWINVLGMRSRTSQSFMSNELPQQYR